MTITITPSITPLAPTTPAPGCQAPDNGDKAFSKLLSEHQPPQPTTQSTAQQAPKNPQTDDARGAKSDAAQTDAAQGSDDGAGDGAGDDTQAQAAGKGTALHLGADRGPSRAASAARDRALASAKVSKMSQDDAAASSDACVDGADKATTDKSTEKDKSKDNAKVDPSLAHFIAALNPQTTAPVDASTTKLVSDGTEALDAKAALAAPGSSARGLQTERTNARGKADAEERGKASFTDAAASATQATDAARIVAEDKAVLHAAADKDQSAQRSVDAAAPSTDLQAVGATNAAAALHAVPPPNTNAQLEQAAPVALTLATPVTTPEFREALGVQVSVMARDGVHRAELHLNPSDMGPISVQIALDGTRAQVDFGADSSATRHIIESGLPVLASALRDAGFTLSGGGVSQHSRQGADGGDAGGRSGGGARRIDGTGDAGSASARRVTVRLPQGSVDLYA